MTKNPTDAQIMMTLSAIAYSGWEFEIRHELKNSKYATQNHWSLVWGPHEDLDLAYRAFVVQDTETPTRYAVVIRGSELSVTNPLGTLINWFNDLDVGTLVPFSDTASQGNVAKGTANAMNDLLDLPSVGHQPKLSDFLTSLLADSEIYVTGHSLGGAQAAVVAAWIAANRPSPSGVKAYTFAAPTPGDGAFATYLASVAEVHRYWNQWDFIPHAFDATGLSEVGTWYPRPGPAQSDLEAFLVAAIQGLPPTPNPYAPAGTGHELKHSLEAASSFLAEVGNQHDKNLYLKLLRLNYTINA